MVLDVMLRQSRSSFGSIPTTMWRSSGNSRSRRDALLSVSHHPETLGLAIVVPDLALLLTLSRHLLALGRHLGLKLLRWWIVDVDRREHGG